MQTKQEGGNVPDKSLGLRRFLQANPVATPEERQELIKSYYLNFGKAAGGNNMFPGGLVPGAPMIMQEYARNPGPAGYEKLGTLTDKKQGVRYTIEDIETVDGADGVPEPSKINYVSEDGTRMSWDLTTNNMGINPVVKAEWGKKNPKTGNPVLPLNVQQAQTDRNPFKHPVKYMSELLMGPNEDTVSDQTLPFSSLWTPEENKLFQQTGKIPPGRDARELNGTGYQPWVNKSSLNRQEPATIKNNGVLDTVWDSNLNPFGLAQRAINAPADWAHNGQPLQLGVSPDAFIPPLNQPKPAYETNQAGQGYQTQPESHSLLTPFKGANDDGVGMGLAKGMGNVLVAGGQMAGGLGEFLTSPLGAATLATGGLAAGAARGAVGATEGLAAARAAVAAAATPAELAAAQSALVTASNAARAANVISGVNSAANAGLQGKFAVDMGTGAWDAGKNAYNEAVGNVPVYNKEGAGYENRGTTNLAGVFHEGANSLMNAAFAGQIGKHTLGAAKDAVMPGQAAVTGAMQNALTLPPVGQLASRGENIGDFLFTNTPTGASTPWQNEAPNYRPSFEPQGQGSAGVNTSPELGAADQIRPASAAAPVSPEYARARAILSGQQQPINQPASIPEPQTLAEVVQKAAEPKYEVPPEMKEQGPVWSPRGQGERPLDPEYQRFSGVAEILANEPVDRSNLVSGPGAGRARGVDKNLDPKIAAEAQRASLGLKPGEPLPSGIPGSASTDKSAAERAASTGPDLTEEVKRAGRPVITDREYDVVNAVRLGTDFLEQGDRETILDGGAVIDPRNVDVPEFAAAKAQGMITPFKKANGVMYWKFTEKGLDLLEQQMEMDGWELKWQPRPEGGTKLVQAQKAPTEAVEPAAPERNILPVDVIKNLRPFNEYSKVLQQQLSDIIESGELESKKASVRKEAISRQVAIRAKLKEIASNPDAANNAPVSEPVAAPVSEPAAAPASVADVIAPAKPIKQPKKPKVQPAAPLEPVVEPAKPPVTEPVTAAAASAAPAAPAAAPLIDTSAIDAVVPPQPKVNMSGPTVRGGPDAPRQRGERGVRTGPWLPDAAAQAAQTAAPQTRAPSPAGQGRVRPQLAKPQFNARGMPILSAKQMFERNNGQLSRLTYSHLKDLYEETVADPSHNPQFASRVKEEMSNRENRFKDTYSPQQEGRNLISGDPVETMTDAQLKDIVDNGQARIRAQREIVAGHNRGDYRSPTRERSQEGKDALRELNRLEYQWQFAKQEQNKRVRVNAGIARPDGSRIVASKERQMMQTRIDPLTGEEKTAPAQKRKPVEALNHARGRFDKLSLDELIAAEGELRKQGRGYADKVRDAIQARLKEGEAVHRRLYGKDADNIPNPRTASREQLEGRIPDLKQEVARLEGEIAEQRKSGNVDPQTEKSLSEARGDLSGFEKELATRDALEKADIRYDASKGNFKQVSGDIQGTGTTPKGSGYKPQPKQPAPEKAPPIEGRDKDVIRNEGAAAYEAEQREAASRANPNPLGLEGQGRDSSGPAWNPIDFNRPVERSGGGELVVDGIIKKYGDGNVIPPSKGLQRALDKLKASTGKDYEVKLKRSAVGGPDGVELHLSEVGSNMIDASATFTVKPNGEIHVDWLNTDKSIERNGVATGLITQAIKTVSEQLRDLDPNTKDRKITLRDASEGGRSTKALSRALGTEVPAGRYRGETRIGSFDQNRDYSRGSSDMPAPDSNNYPGLPFSEADVRRYQQSTPAERTEFMKSLPDKNTRTEFFIMSEYLRNKDWESKPNIAANIARKEAKRQALVDKFKAEGHVNPEWAADRELGEGQRPTGRDPEDVAEERASNARFKETLPQDKPQKPAAGIGSNAIDLDGNKRKQTKAERERFVANEAVYMRLSPSQRRIADTIARGGNTVGDILKDIVNSAKLDKSQTSSMTKMAELLLKNSDQKSLSKMVEMNKDRFLDESYYEGSGIASLNKLIKGNRLQSLSGEVSLSQLHLSDPKDLMRVIMHEFIHATTADKINRALFGRVGVGSFKNDVFGQSGQKYIDRIRAYVRDPKSDKGIVKIGQAYLKYLSTLKDKGDMDTRPITDKKLDIVGNEETGAGWKGNAVGQGIDVSSHIENGQYQASNIHEFVTATMTEPAFQNILKDIKMGNSNAWSKFKDAIADIVGIAPSDSALRYAFDGVMEVSVKDLSEFKKGDFKSQAEGLAQVRMERFLNEGMDPKEARQRVLDELSPGEADAFGFEKQADKDLRTPEDIRADIDEVLAEEREKANSPNMEGYWGRQDKVKELYAELNAAEEAIVKTTTSHPLYEEALRNVEDNNYGTKKDVQDTNDAVVQEIRRLEGIREGNYDAKRTSQDRTRFYEKSRRSEQDLGEELRNARENTEVERARNQARKNLERDDAMWDSLPPEVKAKAEYEATTGAESIQERLLNSETPEADLAEIRKEIARDYNVDPMLLEDKGGKKPELENKGKEEDITGPMTEEDWDSFEQSSDGAPVVRNSFGIEGQGRNSSKVGDFVRKETRASINRAQDTIEVIKKFTPDSKLDVAHKAADIVTLSALSSGQAHLDKLAERNNVPAIREINDLLMGGRAGDMNRAVKNGFHSKVKSENNILNNKLNNALRPLESRLEDMPSAEQAKLLEEVGRAVVSKTRHADAEIAAAADAVRLVYRDMYYMQKNAGIELGNSGPNYMPRMLNHEIVLKNRQKFVNAAAKAYETTGLDPADAMDAANDWWYSIQRGDEGFSYDGNFVFDAAAHNGEPKHTRGRIFNDIAEGHMEPFYNRNVLDATRQYIGRAVKATELAKRFGPDFGRYRDLQQRIVDSGPKGQGLLREVNETVKGQLAPQKIGNSVLRGANDALAVYQSVRFLSRAVISSLGEPIVGAMRTGQVADAGVMMFDSVKQAYRQARRIDPDYHTKLAEDIGAIQSILSDSAITSSVDSRMIDTVSSGLSKKVQNQFFRTTGLHQWTEGTRVASIKLGERFVRRLALDIKSGGRSRELSARYLTELGIDPKDHASFSSFISKLEGMDQQTRLKAITNPRGKHAAAYRDALVRFGEQVIMDPNRGTRARLANHPLGGLIFGLQSYLYAFNENVVKRTLKTTGAAVFNSDKNNMSASNRMMLLAPLAIAPVFAAFQYYQGEFRDEFMSDPSRADDEPLSAGNKFMRMMSRSAFLGRHDFVANLFGSFKYDKDPATAVAGPALGDASTFLKNQIGLYKDSNSPDTNTAERRAARSGYDTGVAPAAGLVASQLPGVTGRLAGTALTYAANHPATREYAVGEVAGPPVQPKKQTQKQRDDKKNFVDLLMEDQ